jgi:hypothetical protein
MRRRGASFVKRTLLAPPVPDPITNFKELNKRMKAPKLGTLFMAAVKPGCSLKYLLAVAVVTALP